MIAGPYGNQNVDNGVQGPRPGAIGDNGYNASLGSGYGAQYAAAGANSGNGGSGNQLTIQTGITPGPIYNQQQMQQALGGFGQRSPMPAAPGVGASPPQANALNQLHNDSMATLNNNNKTQFDREAAMANAQQLLSSQRAQGDAGLQWGNLGTRLAENNFANANNTKTNVLKLSQALGLWG